MARELSGVKEDFPDVIAAVDLGSNSFHLKVARVVDGQLHVIDRIKEMVGLAGGLDEDHRLTPEACERGVECLQRFGQRLREVPPEGVRAVGTNTLRVARNARDFLSLGEEALGHSIDIIAGREEARLIYLGVAHSVTQDEEQRLVVDIGGGSTEFIIGRSFTPLKRDSLYMGCVSMSREFFGDGIIRRKRMRDAQLCARQELESIEEPYRSAGWSAAFGTSGTIITVASVIAANGWGEGISMGALRKVCDALIDAGRVDKFSLPGRQAERASVFPGGVAILMATFEGLGIDRMNWAQGALREGILYDMLRRFTHTDVRESTINDLCKRYHVDLEQAERVERTALELHEKVAKGWRLRKERYANMLGWAARLHEIGLSIAYNQYHKHGAYLLENADLPGFSRHEQSLLAVLVRSHRRKFAVEVFAPLSAKLRDRVERMAILLRLSVALHRSRLGYDGIELTVDADGRSLRVVFPSGWLDEHPLTAADLRQEAAYLESAGYKLSVAQQEV